MSAPAKCPGCAAKLQPEWDACPNCPMSFADAPSEKGAFQNDSWRRLGLPIIFFAGLGLAVWTFGEYLWKTAVDSTETVSVGKETVDRPAEGRVVRGLHGDARSPVDAPALEEPAGSVSVVPEVAEVAPQRKAVVTEWRMRGAIYDLITLKPVPGVNMIFTDNETNSRVQIQTDELGRYRAILPPLAGRGYLVTLSKPDYEKSYLNSGAKGVGQMTLARRKKLAKELSSSIVEPALLEPRSAAPLVTDFHLAPTRLP